MEGHPVNEPHNCIGDDILHPLRKAHVAGKPCADLRSRHVLSKERDSAGDCACQPDRGSCCLRSHLATGSAAPTS